jgi:hypothetical protein
MINLGTSHPVARKMHRCESCGGRVEPGQKYYRARIVDGGEAWVWKAHEWCQKAGDILFANGFDGDDGTILCVMDMGDELRAIVRDADPQTAAAIWPNSDSEHSE